MEQKLFVFIIMFTIIMTVRKILLNPGDYFYFDGNQVRDGRRSLKEIIARAKGKKGGSPAITDGGRAPEGPEKAADADGPPPDAPAA